MTSDFIKKIDTCNFLQLPDAFCHGVPASMAQTSALLWQKGA